MTQAQYNDLKEARRKEKDPRVRDRILAIHMTQIRNCTVEDTADFLMQSTAWVDKWTRRYREGGIDALRDSPRCGRPVKVPEKTIQKVLNGMGRKITPRIFLDAIHKETGQSYHITTKRILHKNGMMPKSPQRIHAGRATVDAIRRWQKNAKRRIARLKKKGFALVIQDESFFMHDPTYGPKYWAAKGTRPFLKCNGRHGKTVAYGAMAADGRRFFWQYDRFDGETFLAYLKGLSRRLGKTVVVMDGASQHRTGDVRRYVAKNRNLKVIYLLTATPELSAMEEYWRQAKRDILVSEYYTVFGGMKRALSEYLRTKPIRLDVMKYLNRKIQVPTNL